MLKNENYSKREVRVVRFLCPTNSLNKYLFACSYQFRRKSEHKFTNKDLEINVQEWFNVSLVEFGPVNL